MTIRAWCPDCNHDVHLEADRMTVRHETTRDWWSFLFACPRCGARTASQPTSKRIADLLVSAGCPVVAWALPARGPRTGPPITAGDVLRFVDALNDWSTHGPHR